MLIVLPVCILLKNVYLYHTTACSSPLTSAPMFISWRWLVSLVPLVHLQSWLHTLQVSQVKVKLNTWHQKPGVSDETECFWGLKFVKRENMFYINALEETSGFEETITFGISSCWKDIQGIINKDNILTCLRVQCSGFFPQNYKWQNRKQRCIYRLHLKVALPQWRMS